MSNEENDQKQPQQGEVRFEQKKLTKDEEEALRKAMEEAIRSGGLS